MVYGALTVEQIIVLDTHVVAHAWHETEIELARLKIRELQLRTALFAKAFPEAQQGVNTLPLGNGYVMKGKPTLNYSVANTAEMRAAALALSSGTAERLIKWSPKLSLTEYQRLSEADRLVIGSHITAKPGVPSLEILAPGEDGNKNVGL